MDDSRVIKVAQKNGTALLKETEKSHKFWEVIFNNLYVLICRKSSISYYRDRFEYFSKDIKKT